ncbi:toxin ParE1/3/4 [Bacillus sp. SLBN-46]|uniref:type II toxin-antitoxin system RelE/ParE family toxin n=1 Tax=Bacillus sp. SLBN-46 TaxID=3042283 RepID=UPI00286630FE|nr:type II toxin-antitoxin system RelE/ParE family toxin [Bacillus sp. SLBN-46]MDR6123441.1 toxin ParE1/3/4 [Bacillus sp. SLBN-46]
MVELRWSESAVCDLEEICNYIANDSEEYAKSFARRIIDMIETIAAFPYSGRIVPEFNEEKIREKIFLNYRIIYLINTDKMAIVRIIHNARNLTQFEL